VVGGGGIQTEVKKKKYTVYYFLKEKILGRQEHMVKI
jgi:hypothetical protein